MKRKLIRLYPLKIEKETQSTALIIDETQSLKLKQHKQIYEMWPGLGLIWKDIAM